MPNKIKKHITLIFLFIGLIVFPQSEAYKNWEENFNLGLESIQTNKLSDSKNYFKKSLELSEKIKDSLPWAKINTSYYYAYILYQLSDYYEAQANYKTTLELAQALPNRDFDFEIQVRSNLVNLSSSLGYFKEAILKQNELNNFIKELKGEKTEVYAGNLIALGQIYFELGDCQNATNYYNTAKNILQELKLRTINTAIVYNNLGLCLFSAGNYTEADNAYLESLTITEELKLEETQFYSKLLSNIAVLSQVQGDYNNSKLLHEHSLAILSSLNLNNTVEYAEGLFAYANLLKDLGMLDEALNEVKESERIYSKYLEKDNLKFADLHTVLAELYLDNGDPKKALKFYEQSAQLFKEKAHESNPGYGYALNGLALTYQALGDYDKALDFSLQSLEYLKKSLTDQHKDYGIVLMNIGNLYKSLGEYNKAYSYLEQAIPVLKNSIGTNNTTYGQLCINILHVALINPDEKLSDLEFLVDFAISIFEANKSKNNLFYNYAHFFKAEIYLEEEKHQEALDLLLKIENDISKNIETDSELYNDIVLYIALSYEYLKDYDNALKYYKKYNAYTIGSVSEVFTFRNEKDKKAYLKKLEYWFSLITYLSQKDYYSNLEITSLSLNNQLLRKGLLLNSSKSILTQLESLNNSKITTKVNTYRNLKNKVNNLQIKSGVGSNETLTKAETDLNRLETELVELYSVHFKNALNYDKDWKNIKNALKSNEVAIEFVSYLPSPNKQDVFSGQKYLAYVIKKESQFPEVIQLFNEVDLKNLLSKKSPNQLYTSRGSKSTSITVSNDMYYTIWKPLEPYLKDIKTIYFSPVGLLNQIPFAALSDSEHELLSEKFDLVQLSSTDILSETFNEPSTNDILFIGGIDYDFSIDDKNEKATTEKSTLETLKSSSGTRSLGTTWNYLPGTLTEVNKLQQVFKNHDKTYNNLTKKQATEEAFKNLSRHSPNIIHIATHGFFFENLPEREKTQLNLTQEPVYKVAEDPLLRSGLILAGANYAWQHGGNPYEDEDGILTALEISNLDLSNTDMVVLSACETGLGDIDSSEGVYGLQRAFKMAGVNIIVMSLWQVPDKETAEFMNLLYSNWLNGMPVRKAFQQTQRTMSAKYKDNPEKWAAFVLFE